MQVLAASVLVLVVAVFSGAQSAVIGVVPATTYVRTPALDSAVIQSDRLGGSFSYSTAENHAYTAVSPVVQNVVAAAPVVSYAAHQVAVPAYTHTAIASPFAYEPTVVVAK